jgi:hypothetical protein
MLIRIPGRFDVPRDALGAGEPMTMMTDLE